VSEVLVAAIAAIAAAGISAVGAYLAAKASRSSNELTLDVREIRAAILRHLEHHP